ncbi:adhesion G protein-coupled receptor E5 [Aulostomus maculatus]
MAIGNELFILGFTCSLLKCFAGCPLGFNSARGDCVDINECDDYPEPCGDHTLCFNTNGSFFCKCQMGFANIKGHANFTGIDGQCQDENECFIYEDICGSMAECSNLIGSYTCTCHEGYYDDNSNGRGDCRDIDECEEDGEDICGISETCVNLDGSYWCDCPLGYTNYRRERTPCSQLNCDHFKFAPTEYPGGLADILFMMSNSCLALTGPSPAGGEPDGDMLLTTLLTASEGVLTSGNLDRSEDMSKLLNLVEDSIKIIGPQLKKNHTRIENNETDVEIATQRARTRPTGPIRLANENATIDMDWTTATDMETYPGFAVAALVSYKKLESSLNHSFEELQGLEKDGIEPSLQVFSRIVSVVVSNPSTQNLSHPVTITLRHLKDPDESSEVSYICAYWKDSHAWSTDGCYKQDSNDTRTVCVCDHLSSFAVLMAIYSVEHTFSLRLITKVGLTISLLCLLLCILTFKFCRSIHGTRTTIHLHLCICLFLADLVFLAGITQTKPVGGCRFVAALLHLFFLGVFTWTLLEGVQLYRMVVLVFNATIRPLYLFITGYGTPLIIVIISAIIRPDGYGTSEYCWLSQADGLIWSFIGPVCLIIVLNVFFFFITVWRLAQKFSSLNPDLSKLNKIKAFTATAVAQLCILGLMWVFGAFLFQKDNIVAVYIFTILNSLQGLLVFVMHCLMSKQVREEYAHFLSCVCTPQKKRYSDFSSTNPSSSQSQESRSGQHTGESQI